MRSINITSHARLGPVLFVLLGFACAYLGCWFPLWRDRVYPAEFDTRIGIIIAGFAPMTTSSAGLALFGYIRLWRFERKSRTTAGQVLLATLFLPLFVSVATGIWLAHEAVVLLPEFLTGLWLTLWESVRL